MTVGEVHDIELDGIAHGGEAVGRLPDGRACFVGYAVPGERVRVRVTEQRRRWARARLLEVLRASPDRVEPPCPLHGPEPDPEAADAGERWAARCGGCRLQHVTPSAQRRLKARVVREQLERIGKVADPPVPDEAEAVADLGYRARARMAADDDGRLGFRRAGRDDVVAVDRCPLLTDAAQQARERAGDGWAPGDEVEVRVGEDGACLVVHPGPGALAGLPGGDDAIALVDDAGRAHALRGDPTVRWTVPGGSLRAGPTTFLQPGPDGAAALTRAVLAAAGDVTGLRAVDLFAGAGLLSLALADAGASVLAVERSRQAAADCEATLDGCDAEVWQVDADRAAAALADGEVGADLVVLDPPRRGAGRRMCERLAAWGGGPVVYVSCDPAALARDVAVLTDGGMRLVAATPIDLFAQTAQVETVALLRPAGR